MSDFYAAHIQTWNVIVPVAQSENDVHQGIPQIKILYRVPETDLDSFLRVLTFNRTPNFEVMVEGLVVGGGVAHELY